MPRIKHPRFFLQFVLSIIIIYIPVVHFCRTNVLTKEELDNNSLVLVEGINDPVVMKIEEAINLQFFKEMLEKFLQLLQNGWVKRSSTGIQNFAKNRTNNSSLLPPSIILIHSALSGLRYPGMFAFPIQLLATHAKYSCILWS